MLLNVCIYNTYKASVSQTQYSRSCPVINLQTLSLSLSHIATDGQSVCLSWYRAPSGVHDQILVTF
jgi:hypothetical protein